MTLFPKGNWRDVGRDLIDGPANDKFDRLIGESRRGIFRFRIML